ncbi:MAG: S1C family serine protease, partial [Candidatus Nitrosopolaris sp.]
MYNPQLIPMRKRFAFAAAIVFAAAIMMLTIPSKVVVAQQQQINSNISSSRSTNSPNPLSLNTIFKQTKDSVVQITSKIPTTTSVANPLNQSSNATTLGSGFIYDKQGHIVTNGHVVGDAKMVDVTFPDGNRYTAKVIANDVYG